jgi:hypothetical protein
MHLRRVTLVLTLCAAGCGKQPVDPLDCKFPDSLDQVSVSAAPAAEVDFRSDWGTAPTRMALRLFRSDGRQLGVQGCGRDEGGQEWELQAKWTRLAPGTTEAEARFFDVARLDAGERLASDEPDFAGSLLRCKPDPVGCYAVDRAAFAYQYSLSHSQSTSGLARLRDLDFGEGRFSGDVFADPGEPREGPPTRVNFAVTWDASAWSALSAAQAGAEPQGEGGANP